MRATRWNARLKLSTGGGHPPRRQRNRSLKSWLTRPPASFGSMVVAASWPWHWSASAWSALTFLVFAAAAIFARRQAMEARRLREQQTRPFVLIDFRVHQTVIEIVITNVGATLARDVRFEFDQPLVSAYDSEPGSRRKVAEIGMLSDGIASLAPHKEMKVFFDRFPSRAEAGLPMTYKATVSYGDPSGQEYVEEQVLDLNVYVGTGGIRQDGLHEIHTQVKKIAEQMEKWTDWDGLRIITSSDIDERDARWDREQAKREAAAAPPREASPAEVGASAEDSETHSPR